MEMCKVQYEVYRRQRLLEDEEHARNNNRSNRLVRSRSLFGRNQRAFMETSFHKNIRNLHKKLGEEVQQDNRELHNNTFTEGEKKNSQRRSRDESEWKENILLACERIRNRIQVLRSRREKKHGELPTLKPPDKEKRL